MNKTTQQWWPSNENALKRLIEPLACYICAMEQPKAALVWTLVALFDELDQINDAANVHIATFSENHLG